MPTKEPKYFKYSKAEWTTLSNLLRKGAHGKLIEISADNLHYVRMSLESCTWFTQSIFIAHKTHRLNYREQLKTVLRFQVLLSNLRKQWIKERELVEWLIAGDIARNTIPADKPLIQPTFADTSAVLKGLERQLKRLERDIRKEIGQKDRVITDGNVSALKWQGFAIDSLLSRARHCWWYVRGHAPLPQIQAGQPYGAHSEFCWLVANQLPHGTTWAAIRSRLERLYRNDPYGERKRNSLVHLK